MRDLLGPAGRHLSTDPGARDLGLTLAACLVVPLIGAATFDLLSFATVTGLSFLLVGAAGSLLRDAVETARRNRESGTPGGPVSARQPGT